MMNIYIYKANTNFDINDLPKAIIPKDIDNKKEMIHLFSWAMLKRILLLEYNIDITNLPITYNEYGKPFIDMKLYFNISHSNDIVAIVISNKPCGIDIEYYKENRRFDKLSKHVFKKIITDPEEFYINWVKKEAYVKRIGSSIMLDVDYEESRYEKFIFSDGVYYLGISSEYKNYNIYLKK